MIYTPDDLYAPGMFNEWGRDSNPMEWESKMPGFAVFNSAMTDPALMPEILGGPAAFDDVWSGGEAGKGYLKMAAEGRYISQLGLYSVTGAMRNAIGGVATTVGFLQRSVGVITGVYETRIDQVAAALNVVSGVLDSQAFNAAINAIGMIPIVGWIIKILVEVAKIITSIVGIVAEKNREEAEEALAQVATLPMPQWSAQADGHLAKLCQISAATYNLQWLVMPRYPAYSPDDFTGKPIDANNDDRWEGWIVHPALFTAPETGSAPPPGLGFVPGTRNIHATMQLLLGGAKNITDLGTFYPVASMTASNLWESMLKGTHPSTMCVDTDLAMGAWEAYIHAALDFAFPTEFGGSGILARGWSMSPSANFGAGSHTCVAGMENSQGCSSGDVTWARSVGIPGSGHTSAFIAYLNTLFDFERKNDAGEWVLGNIDTATSRPVKALQELRDAQSAMVDSMDCMYLTDMETSQGRAQFAALGVDAPNRRGPLWNKWANNVQKVFDSGSWANINWADVPQHADDAGAQGTPGRNRVRDSIENMIASKYSMGADEFFATKHQWMLTTPENVLPDTPVPPPAPTAPAVIESTAWVDMTRVGGASAGGVRTSAAGLAMAAGVAMLLLKGRK